MREGPQPRRQLPCQPEIRELDVTIGRKQGILRLQIAVDHAVPVDVLERESELRTETPHRLQRQAPARSTSSAAVRVSAQGRAQIAARRKLEEEVEPARVLCVASEVRDEPGVPCRNRLLPQRFLCLCPESFLVN